MKTTTYLLACITLCISPVFGSIYSQGHGDLGLGEGDELELHLHLHEGTIVDGTALAEDAEFQPDQASILVPASAAIPRPSETVWDFIGNNAGDDTWILPESHSLAETLGTPFLGIGAGGINTGVFVNDEITLTFTGLNGPGLFSLYTVGLAGPTAYMASSDGISANDSIRVTAGTHGHFNFAFSEAGTYQLTFEVSAIEAGTQNLLTDEATFTFQVVPEPATLSMLALGGAISLLRRKQ